MNVTRPERDLLWWLYAHIGLSRVYVSVVFTPTQRLFMGHGVLFYAAEEVHV